MQQLRQSGAFTDQFGPFLDEDDGKTIESGLTINRADVRVSKNGAAYAQKDNTSAATYDEGGEYRVSFDAGDTDTLGRLKVRIHKSGALPVWKEYMVLSQQVWDSIYSTDRLQVDVREIGAGVIPGVTVSGHTPGALSEIVASGNAEGWNLYSDATLANQTDILNRITNVSGLVNTLEAGQTTIQSQNSYISTQVSGVPDIDTIVASGNAEGWGDTASAPVTVSGHTPGALSQIVSSGNAEGWNLYSDATLANQTEILTRVTNVSGLVDTLETGQTTIQSQNSYISTQVSGVPDIDTIVASGDASGWGDTASAPVTVSGHTPGALSQIVSSGNGAGWNLYSDATLANQTEILNRVTNVSGLVTALNNPTTGEIVSGIFDEVISGTKDFRTAAIEIWAYCANDVNLSGTISGVLHTYYDPGDNGIFTLEAQPSGRIRSDI